MSSRERIDKGDCFKSNGELFERQWGKLGALLVHGICKGAGGEIKDIPFVHCWIEYQGIVIDESNGRKVTARIEDYYRIGRIMYTEKYTLKEAERKMFETGMWGCWTEKLHRVCDEAVRAVMRRRASLKAKEKKVALPSNQIKNEERYPAKRQSKAETRKSVSSRQKTSETRKITGTDTSTNRVVHSEGNGQKKLS
jgi:hypothetical protein